LSAFAVLQELVEECALRLGTSVVVQNSQHRIVAYAVGDPATVDDVRRLSILGRTAPAEIGSWLAAQNVYQAREPIRVRVPEEGSPGYLGRLGVPLRVRDTLVGILWLIDETERIGQTELASVAGELAQSALWLYEEEMAQRLASESLAQLLSPDSDIRSAAALDLVERGHHHDEELIVVVQRREGVQDRTLGGYPAWIGPSGIGRMRSSALMLSDHNAFLIPLTSALGLSDLLGRLQLQVGQEEKGAAFGIGEPVMSLDQVERSYRQALRAMRCAERLPEFRGVSSWSELGILRLLPLSAHGAGGVEVLDERISPLLEPRNSVLLETAVVYLDEGGDIKSTATRLQVHRGTLYYRLARVEELTGYKLSRGMDRLSLHASVTLARLWGYA